MSATYLQTQPFLQRIKDLLHTQLPYYTSAQLVYRGTSLPMDALLTGYTRFAYKLGNTAAVMFSNAWTTLTQEAPQNGDTLYPDDIPNWAESGVLLYVGRESLHPVLTIDRDEGEIVIEDTLPATYSAETPLIYYAYPIALNGDTSPASPGTTQQLSVNTTWKIFIGDKLAIEATEGLVNSVSEYEVTAATETAYSGGVYTFVVDIDAAIPRVMLDNERLYLVCNLGYESNRVFLPTNPTFYYQINVPFLIDWFSGNLLDTVTTEEVYGLETYDGGGSVIQAMHRTSKNTPILDAPIHNSAPLFWTCSRGTLKYSTGYTLLITDWVETEETFGIDDEHYDEFGSLTGVAGAYYVNLSKMPYSVENVKRGSVEESWVRPGGAQFLYFRVNPIISSAAYPTVLISTSSTDDPCVITTAAHHHLSVGNTIIIEGHTGTTPSINGEHEVLSVLNDTQFTIGYHLFSGGSGGTLRRKRAVVYTAYRHGLTSGDGVRIADHTSTPDINGDHDNIEVFGAYSFSVPNIDLTAAGSGGTFRSKRAVDVIYKYNPATPDAIDLQGHAFVWTDLVPAWEEDNDWSLSLESDTGGRVRVRFYPNDWQELLLPMASPATFTVRLTPSVPIRISTAGNPVVVTCNEVHNLEDGDGVIIEGHVGAVPDLNGEHHTVLEVLTPTTFTIDLNVTTGGVGGTVRKQPEPATRLELTYLSAYPESTLKLGDWSANGTLVRSLKYTVVACSQGGNEWAGTGLIVKPVFMDILNLQTRLDRDNLNKGSIIL